MSQRKKRTSPERKGHKVGSKQSIIGYSSPQPFWPQWFGDGPSVLHLLCTLLPLLGHQLHFRSLGIRSQRLGAPDIVYSGNVFSPGWIRIGWAQGGQGEMSLNRNTGARWWRVYHVKTDFSIIGCGKSVGGGWQGRDMITCLLRGSNPGSGMEDRLNTETGAGSPVAETQEREQKPELRRL